MKAFFEEYGFILLSAFVVVALIVIAGTMKTTVATYAENIIATFGTSGVNWANSIPE